jgi:hypothetical protein
MQRVTSSDLIKIVEDGSYAEIRTRKLKHILAQGSVDIYGSNSVALERIRNAITVIRDELNHRHYDRTRLIAWLAVLMSMGSLIVSVLVWRDSRRVSNSERPVTEKLAPQK